MSETEARRTVETRVRIQPDGTRKTVKVIVIRPPVANEWTGSGGSRHY